LLVRSKESTSSLQRREKKRGGQVTDILKKGAKDLTTGEGGDLKHPVKLRWFGRAREGKAEGKEKRP